MELLFSMVNIHTFILQSSLFAQAMLMVSLHSQNVYPILRTMLMCFFDLMELTSFISSLLMVAALTTVDNKRNLKSIEIRYNHCFAIESQD